MILFRKSETDASVVSKAVAGTAWQGSRLEQQSVVIKWIKFNILKLTNQLNELLQELEWLVVKWH